MYDWQNTSGFTFASHNGQSVVDYLLCSAPDSYYINTFCILDLNEFSDHSPVTFSLSSKYIFIKTRTCLIKRRGSIQKLFYDEEKIPIFRNELITCDCVLSQLIDNVNTGQVDCIVQSFTNYVYDCASSGF